MTDVKRVIIDAGHGGEEPGAMYDGRREKDDTLRLALAIGRILENNGVDVVYTRTTDVYDTPLEKARIANQSGADYFVSIHRNAFPVPGTASGAMTLVYEDAGVRIISSAIWWKQGSGTWEYRSAPVLSCCERHRCLLCWWKRDLLIIRMTTGFLMRILMPLPRP